MKNVSLQEFTDLIADVLGLYLRDQVKATLWEKILTRMKVLGFSSPDLYYQFLTSGRHAIPHHSEWRELINLLSVTESYFFRDKGQFSLLRKTILPMLIASKLNGTNTEESASHLNARTNQIRVWSAGCSTGEEAYSLAILFSELVPKGHDLSIRVIGTDINQLAIEQARQGIYSDWSFRSVDPDIQRKYFRLQRRGWEIDPAIRNLVSFQVDNLVKTGLNNDVLGQGTVDLIVCRNVFIYFDAGAIARVLHRFDQTLIPNGYLMTGHTELYGQNHSHFEVKIFPDSIIYQRKSQTALHANPCHSGERVTIPRVTSVQPPSATQWLGNGDSAIAKVQSSKEMIDAGTNLPVLSVHKGSDGNRHHKQPTQFSDDRDRPHAQLLSTKSHHGLLSPVNLFDQLISLMDRKAYLQVIQTAQQLIVQEPNHLGAYCLLAEAYANSGDHDRAVQTCQQALEFNPFAIEPFYLLAQIAEEQGDLEGAKVMLKRIIYLSPTSVYAYFQLGCLYEQEGNLEKAQRNWRSALDVINQLASKIGNSSIGDRSSELTRQPRISQVEQAIAQKLKFRS